MQPTPWFVQAFGPNYPRVYAARDGSLAATEAQFLANALNLRAGMNCLDIACGQGRHLQALRTSGATMVGVDLSWALLQAARGAAVVRGDMRALPFADNSFHAAYSVFSSFGYFEDEQQDVQSLREAWRVLAPGGRFVLDLAEPQQVRAQLVPRSERVQADAAIVEERRMEGRCVLKRVRITCNGRTEEWEERLRLYTPQEAAAALQAVGFHPLRLAGGLCGEATSGSARHVHVAEKRA